MCPAFGHISFYFRIPLVGFSKVAEQLFHKFLPKTKNSIRVHIFKDLTMCKRMLVALLPGGSTNILEVLYRRILKKSSSKNTGPKQ